MLLAGSVLSIACIIYRIPLLQTLGIVLITLIVFYGIGLIIRRIILKINQDAEQRAELLKSEETAAEQQTEEKAAAETMQEQKQNQEQ